MEKRHISGLVLLAQRDRFGLGFRESKLERHLNAGHGPIDGDCVKLVAIEPVGSELTRDR